MEALSRDSTDPSRREAEARLPRWFETLEEETPGEEILEEETSPSRQRPAEEALRFSRDLDPPIGEGLSISRSSVPSRRRDRDGGSPGGSTPRVPEGKGGAQTERSPIEPTSGMADGGFLDLTLEGQVDGSVGLGPRWEAERPRLGYWRTLEEVLQTLRELGRALLEALYRGELRRPPPGERPESWETLLGLRGSVHGVFPLGWRPGPRFGGPQDLEETRIRLTRERATFLEETTLDRVGLSSQEGELDSLLDSRSSSRRTVGIASRWRDSESLVHAEILGRSLGISVSIVGSRAMGTARDGSDLDGSIWAPEEAGAYLERARERLGASDVSYVWTDSETAREILVIRPRGIVFLESGIERIELMSSNVEAWRDAERVSEMTPSWAVVFSSLSELEGDSRRDQKRALSGLLRVASETGLCRKKVTWDLLERVLRRLSVTYGIKDVLRVALSRPCYRDRIVYQSVGLPPVWPRDPVYARPGTLLELAVGGLRARWAERREAEEARRRRRWAGSGGPTRADR